MERSQRGWVRNPDGSPGWEIEPVKAPPYRMVTPELEAVCQAIEPSTFLVSPNLDLFDMHCPVSFLAQIFLVVRNLKHHHFAFWGAHPEHLGKFRALPPNCWAGLRVGTVAEWHIARQNISRVVVPVRYLEMDLKENILENPSDLVGFNWLILGADDFEGMEQSVEYLLKMAVDLEIPVFMKDSLRGRVNNGLFIQQSPWWTLEQASTKVAALPEKSDRSARKVKKSKRGKR